MGMEDIERIERLEQTADDYIALADKQKEQISDLHAQLAAAQLRVAALEVFLAAYDQTQADATAYFDGIGNEALMDKLRQADQHMRAVRAALR